METAAGSERRSTPGPAVPPPPRGHAPLATASGPLSSPAREPPQPEEERQLRISESGQFSDGLEDRGTQFIVGRCSAVCRWYRGLGHLDLDHQSWMDAAGTWRFSERASQPLQNPWTLANVPIPGGQARPSDR